MKKNESSTAASKSPKRSETQAELAQKEAGKKTKTVDLKSTMAEVKEFCKHFAEAEEAEMERRTGEEDLKLFKETCLELRKLMTEILQLKLGGKADDETKREITEKRVEASLLFVTLKKLNRLDKLRLKKARDQTHDAKQRVDSFHLELENLLYEVFHLRKEVDKCLEFKSKDEDIELVPVEEFYKEAPSNISKPELTKSNKHKLTLARLEWEFEQRKRLSEQCKALEQSREKASNDISQKQKQLESLLPRLNAIMEATRPLQEELGLPVERIKFQKELAALLPDPLYILYSQLKAYIEACDHSMQVTIEGGMEEARSFGLSCKPTLLEEALEDVDSAESDVEMDTETSKRAATSSKKTGDWQLSRHPLCIQLTIDRVAITFSYLTTPNIVTVDCKSSTQEEKNSTPGAQRGPLENLLSGLFESDDGEESPNWANSFQARAATASKAGELGKPYRWAQRLAGLDFNGAVKTSPISSVNADYVQSVVGALKCRIKHRFDLERILRSLEKGELCVNAESRAVFPANISSRLASWSAVGYEDCVRASKPLEDLLTATKLNPKNLMFFNAVIQRNSAKLKAATIVPIDYPDSSPIFSLELDWHGRHTRGNSEIIRNIEADVNVLRAELPASQKIDLLSIQLKTLCLHLDLITEVDGQLLKKEGGSWQSSQSSIEFPAEKMVPQLIKGHDRVPPTQFDAATGFFLHR